MTNKLDLLKKLGDVVNSLKDKVTPDSYWETEERFLKKRIEENKKNQELITMSYEKFHEPFTI